MIGERGPDLHPAHARADSRHAAPTFGIWRVAAACVLVVATMGAQDLVRVDAIDGKRITGTVIGFADGTLRLAPAASEQAVGEWARPLDELRTITHEATVPAELPPAGLVVLWSGQTLRGNVRGVKSDGGVTNLLVDVPPARALASIPLRSIRALRCTDQARSDGEGFEEALREGANRDLLFAYRRGDPSQGLIRLTVAVAHFEQQGDDVFVVVDFDGKRQPAQPLAKIYAIVLGQGAAPDPQRGARTTAHVTGGPAFTGLLTALDPATDRCVLRLDEGCELDLPWQRVVRLAIRSDRMVYLSDLDPIEVAQTPALTRKWEWLRDRAPMGAGIELRGELYERGLVLIPRTRLTFDLGGRFDRFEATVGIDDRAGDVGDAIVRISGDGNVLFEAENVRRGTLPHPVRVSVKDVRRLVLETDFGERLDLGDHCAFADARVLRDS